MATLNFKILDVTKKKNPYPTKGISVTVRFKRQSQSRLTSLTYTEQMLVNFLPGERIFKQMAITQT